MSDAEGLSRLADRLSDVLLEETALLDALDLAGAGALLSRKQAAVVALQQAVAGDGGRSRVANEDPEAIRGSVDRLQRLAEANRAALERGLATQSRLIQTIARAVPAARAIEAPVYLSNGSKLPPRPPQAYAFLSRM